VFGVWGLGVLGLGYWAKPPLPNPQSPIPNPQSNNFKFKKNILFKKLNNKINLKTKINHLKIKKCPQLTQKSVQYHF
jgi:hypothetical protein